MRRLSFSAAVLLAGALAAGTASAQEPAARGAYVGLGYGVMHLKTTKVPGDFSFSDTGGGYRLFGGYQWNQYFAVEGAWQKTNNLSDSTTLPTLGTLDVSTDFRVAQVKAIGILPLNHVRLFAGIGIYESHTRADGTITASPTGTAPSTVISETDKSNHAGLATSIGAKYRFGPADVRGELQWFSRPSGGDASGFMVGAAFHF